MTTIEHCLDSIPYFLKLTRGQLNCTVDAVKDPAEDFFSEGPNTLSGFQFLQ